MKILNCQVRDVVSIFEQKSDHEYFPVDDREYIDLFFISALFELVHTMQ